jgi:hypothetical protein
MGVRGLQRISIGDGLFPATGEVGFLFPPPDFSVETLFATRVPVSEGSTVVINESVQLVFSIDNPSLVSLDKRWFGGKPYLGTYKYTTLEQLGRNAFSVGASGFLENLSVDIDLSASYLVVGDPVRNPGVGGTIHLDPCNFRIAPDQSTILPPGDLPSFPEYISKGSTRAFKGNLSSELYPLGVGDYRSLIDQVGLFLLPGVSCLSATKVVSIGGQVQSARPASLAMRSCDGADGKCSQRTDDFFARQAASGPFRTYQDALAAIPPDATDPEVANLISLREVELSPGCVVTYYGTGILEG